MSNIVAYGTRTGENIKNFGEITYTIREMGTSTRLGLCPIEVLAGHPKKFKMAAEIATAGERKAPKPDIRVLGTQFDTAIEMVDHISSIFSRGWVTETRVLTKMAWFTHTRQMYSAVKCLLTD